MPESATQSRNPKRDRDEGERTLVVVDDVAQMVATRVVGFAHAHGVVRKVDVAVVAWSVKLFVSHGAVCMAWGVFRSELTKDCKCVSMVL